MSHTVLVVDDDVNARIIAATLLRVRGVEVRVAEDGIETCDILQREDIAILILELHLPGMNGFEVLRRLRGRFGRLRTSKAPRIMVVTNRQEPEVEHFVRRLGADAFMRKPVEPGQFIATVEHLIDTPRQSRYVPPSISASIKSLPSA